jgi:hypothetical protein
MKKGLLHTKYKITQSGFSLVEILVATSVFLISIMNVNVNTEKQLKRSVNSERATALAEEGLEATRNIRDESFENLIDGTYGLIASSTQWVLEGSSDVTDIFTREIVINTIDTNQKKIETIVTWDDQIGLNNSVTLQTYLTNWQAFVPPAGLTLKKVIINYFSTKTAADFAPYKAETVVGTSTITNIFDVNTAIESPAGTYTFDAFVDLTPGTYTVSETVNPNYTQTFSGDCDVNGSVTLASYDAKVCTITNEEKYATLTVIKQVSNSGGTKTIADFAPYKFGTTEIVENTPTKVQPGTYAITETQDPDYVATFSGDCNSGGSVTLATGDSKTCIITNTQSSWLDPNTQISTRDLSGVNDGRKIQVQGQYVYMIRADGAPDFAIFNISNPASPVLTGSLSLTNIPLNIFVSGNYAYVSSDSDTQELQIINITNPANPTLAGSYNAGGAGNANGIYVVGNTAYLTRTFVTGFANFEIINITNPASPTLIGSLNTSSSVNYEVYVSGNYAYIASGNNNQELEVINITNPASPTLAGVYNATGNTDAISINGSGSVVLIAQGSTLYHINVNTPTSPALLGTYGNGGTINDISIWGSAQYAFLATSNASADLRVVNIASATPSVVGSYNAGGIFNGVAYDQNTNRAYMAGALDSAELTVVKP